MTQIIDSMNDTRIEYNFRGKLFKGEECVDNLHFRFVIDRIKASQLEGQIIGTKNTCNLLERFAAKLEVRDFAFSIEGTTEEGLTISIQKCYIRVIGTRIFPDQIYELEHEVAELYAEDICVKRIFGKEPQENLYLGMRFKLNTRGILTLISSEIRTTNPDGSIEIESIHAPKTIEVELGQLSFCKRYSYVPMVHEKTKGEYVYYSSTAEFELKSVSSNNYNESIEQAKKVVSDFLLLVSFMSRKRVRFHNCVAYLFTENKKQSIGEIEYYETNTLPEEYWVSSSDCIIHPKDFDDFLQIAYKSYLTHKDKLESIIQYYITSQEEKLMESAFLILYIALEALVFQFLQSKPKKGHLRRNIESMTKKYNIHVDDLYPFSENSFKFVRIRHKLIHTGKISDRYEFWKETIKLQLLVERMILRILGWGRERDSTSDYPMYRFQS